MSGAILSSSSTVLMPAIPLPTTTSFIFFMVFLLSTALNVYCT